MESLQLEFNFESLSPTDAHLSQMQKQIDLACESMGKVRRKMFAELGSVKSHLDKVIKKNAELEKELMRLRGDKIEWLYCHDEFLVQQLAVN